MFDELCADIMDLRISILNVKYKKKGTLYDWQYFRTTEGSAIVEFPFQKPSFACKQFNEFANRHSGRETMGVHNH